MTKYIRNPLIEATLNENGYQVKDLKINRKSLLENNFNGLDVKLEAKIKNAFSSDQYRINIMGKPNKVVIEYDSSMPRSQFKVFNEALANIDSSLTLVKVKPGLMELVNESAMIASDNLFADYITELLKGQDVDVNFNPLEDGIEVDIFLNDPDDTDVVSTIMADAIEQYFGEEEIMFDVDLFGDNIIFKIYEEV